MWYNGSAVVLLHSTTFHSMHGFCWAILLRNWIHTQSKMGHWGTRSTHYRPWSFAHKYRIINAIQWAQLSVLEWHCVNSNTFDAFLFVFSFAAIVWECIHILFFVFFFLLHGMAECQSKCYWSITKMSFFLIPRARRSHFQIHIYKLFQSAK